MYFVYPRNPGTVEELHARWKEMLPQPFEGAKLLVQKGLSNNFQVRNHDLIFFLLYITGLTCTYNVKCDAKWVQVGSFPKNVSLK